MPNRCLPTFRQALLPIVSILLWSAGAPASAENPNDGTHPARDTLAPSPDDNADAQACIDVLAWEPGEFTVTVQSRTDADYDALVSFPSPRPSGDELNDRVTMEWYAAHDSTRPDDDPTTDRDGPVIRAPAVLVIHESGSRMEAGRMFAKSLRGKGLHTFLIHLPWYGERRGNRPRPKSADFTALMRQGIADARRARDAIAAVPQVDADLIGVQGTSLGGFVATPAASLDGCFNRVFIMLAGADLYDIIQNGEKDTAKLREELAELGIEGEQLRELLQVVEPTRIAHRLDPDKTWMYIARDDEVVPLKNARLLAQVAGLDASHRVETPGTHYSVVIYFPFIIDHMSNQMQPVISEEK